MNEIEYRWRDESWVLANCTRLATMNANAFAVPPWNEVKWSMDPDHPDRRWNSHALFSDFVADGGAVFLSAEYCGEIVGIGVAVRFNEKTLHELPWLDFGPAVDDYYAALVVVEPEYRRRGVFEELAKRRLQFAVAREPRCIWVQTHAVPLNGTRKVQQFYLDNGFEPCGEFIVDNHGEPSPRTVLVRRCS